MEVSGRKEWDKNTSTNKQRGQQIILCQPCQSEGDTVEAEGFCETCNEFICSPCLKAHRKMKVSKNHVIKPKDEMPKHKVKQKDQCSELCTVHKTEIVKYYCEDHDSVGCGDCMVFNHKTCSVKLVSDVSDYYDTSQEFVQIKKEIETLQRKLSSHRDDIVNDLKIADEMRERIIKEIKRFRKDINEYLDNAERDLLNEIDMLKTKQVSQLKHIQGEFETMESEIKKCEREIFKNSNKINDLFVAAKTSQEKIKAYHMKTEKLASKYEIEILNFLKSDEFVTLLTNKFPIGEINLQSRGIQTNHKKGLIDAQTRLLKSLTVRDLKDTMDCYISGMTVLSRDELLLVDNNNCSLKILDVKENKLTSKYTTVGNPWDITSIESGTFAVTLRSTRKIIFINATNGISKSHSITVRKKCRGIDYRDGVLAVSCANPASVQLLDMKGTILHELDIETHCLFPDYIALSNINKSFIVSDCLKNVLYEISVDGYVKAEIAGNDLETPRGLVMTDDGTIIVCCEKISDKLKMQIPKKDEVLSIAVKGVKKPCNLALSYDQSRMFVFDLSEKDIKVFDLL